MSDESVHEATHSQEGVRHTLEITVPAARMAEQVDEVARAYRGHARLPGFRKGKAPLEMVRKQYGDDIRDRVLDSAIKEHLSIELQERELEPIDSPQLEAVQFEAGEELRFTVHFDTAPEVEVASLELSASRPAVQITDEMVDEALENLRDRAARLVPADEGETIAEGSYARCHLELLPKDGKGRRLAEENRFVLVGQEQAIPGLNEELLGCSEGDERGFVTQLSDGFPNAVLAGKEVHCRVRVEELKRRQLPELDDDFAADVGAENLEALRAATATDLEAHLNQQADRELEGRLLEQLRTSNPVQVPESLIERRLDELSRRFAHDLAHQGVDPREAVDWRAFREQSRDNASNALAEEMLLDRIAEDAELAVEDDAVRDEIATQVQQSEGGNERTAQSLIQQMRKDGSFEGVRLSLRRRKALDHLKQRATIDLDDGEKASTEGASD